MMKIITGVARVARDAKRMVEEQRSSRNPIVRRGAWLAQGLWRALRTLTSLCVDADARSVLLLRLMNPRNVHQTTPFTCMERYPVIFAACRDYCAGREGLRILSYGCSTGEEVLTLRKYFPTAHIVGAEINRRSLAICQRLPVDEKIAFIYSRRDNLQRHGPFDLIFCMAVLQRRPHHIAASGTVSLRKIYPFEKYERQIIELDALLAPGGLLIIHFTQYSLLDTRVAANYEPWGNCRQENDALPVFDRNSHRVIEPLPQHSIFIKLRE